MSDSPNQDAPVASPQRQPELQSDQRAILRLSLATLAVGALALVWELLAHQAPYTPTSISSLVAPVAQLRNTAFTTGLILLGLVHVLPSLSLPRWWVSVVALATLAMLITLGACAAANRMGLQLHDPQPEARIFVYARLVTEGFACLLLVDLARRALWVRRT